MVTSLAGAVVQISKKESNRIPRINFFADSIAEVFNLQDIEKLETYMARLSDLFERSFFRLLGGNG